jgi:hypothetical protein
MKSRPGERRALELLNELGAPRQQRRPVLRRSGPTASRRRSPRTGSGSRSSPYSWSESMSVCHCSNYTAHLMSPIQRVEQLLQLAGDPSPLVLGSHVLPQARADMGDVVLDEDRLQWL